MTSIQDMSIVERNPEKLPPIHPGEILNEEFLVPMNVTQYWLAKSIGVDPRRIHAIVHRERGISAETALLFSRFFGVLDGVAKPIRSGKRRRPPIRTVGHSDSALV